MWLQVPLGLYQETIKHTFREGNRSANALARKGSDFSIQLSADLSPLVYFVVYPNPPDFLIPVLAAEANGEVLYRTVF